MSKEIIQFVSSMVEGWDKDAEFHLTGLIDELCASTYEQGWMLGYEACQEDQANPGPLPNWGDD